MKNHVQIIGNVGRAPEQSAQTRDGKPVVRFAVAQDVAGVDAATQKVVRKDPQWFQVSCFAQVAERALSLSKGDLILVAGELKSRTYQTKDGEKRNAVDLIAHEIYRLERLKRFSEHVPASDAALPDTTSFEAFDSIGELND